MTLKSGVKRINMVEVFSKLTNMYKKDEISLGRKLTLLSIQTGEKQQKIEELSVARRFEAREKILNMLIFDLTAQLEKHANMSSIQKYTFILEDTILDKSNWSYKPFFAAVGESENKTLTWDEKEHYMTELKTYISRQNLAVDPEVSNEEILVISWPEHPMICRDL